MYPSLAEIKEYLKKDAGKPFLLVEYCHGMGNGPGDLEDYFQAIHEDDRMCGGFVWEWCDHAIAHGRTESGKTKYHYGGDHKENIHDGNFCIDGLVYPDRTPHTGLLEYKNVYRPVRIVAYNENSGELVLHNYMDFDNLQDYVEISYEMAQDGTVIEKGSLPGVSAPPHSDAAVNLNLAIPSTGTIYLKLSYRLKKEIPLLEYGDVLGFDEILLANEDGRNRQVLQWLEQKPSCGSIAVTETDTQIVLLAKNFSYKLDKRTGMFTQIQFAGKDYLNHPMELNIWRAPTDNDMYIREEWKKAHYHEAYTRAYQIETLQDMYSVILTEHLAVVAVSVQKILDVRITWKIDESGKLSSTITATKDEEFPELPRFGIRLFLDKKLENVSYFGMGPQESYRDKHRGSYHGLFHSKASQMHEDYIRPQENGSHFDCDYVTVENTQSGITAVSRQPFSFNASIYTQEELERAAHNYELEESDSTVLCIDYALNGIGSNSCGPEVLSPYRFDDTVFQFQLELVPFVKA